ncbi:VOC family protein [uncultured Tateyamaria sp.]|uniref:VOC family protein n=1 Tax=uncultured Tateyamaria sp. TaxID=455651 RepID=UPI00260DC96E|nr:VOC family protein [uncultured Tateyamaria sp.]
MPLPFVWFDNISAQRQDTVQFMQDMFGWRPSDIGSMTFLTSEGETKPFAAACEEMPEIAGWVPYVEVDDLQASVARARESGASILFEGVKGPAGDASFIRDPGGSVMALWKRGQDV